MDNNQEEINMDLLQNINAQNISGPGRRRGHQHHIRHLGTRTSNIEADEILAALRRGDQMPITETIQQYFTPSLHNLDIDTNSNDENLIDDEKSLYSDDKNHDDCNKNNEVILMSQNLCQPIGLTVARPHETSFNINDNDDGNLTNAESEANNYSNSDINMQIALTDSLNDSINSSSSGKSKSKKLKKIGANTLDTESDFNKDVKKRKHLPPMEERPPLEGADADYWTENMDVENDPEAAEWSKLRCTSERTEVIAEREYRRQNRRCADYPGLAFGRSIFSSDTMMKLNIIRNELHNIMKTQLKRVRAMEVDATRYTYKCIRSNCKISFRSLPKVVFF